MLFVFSGRGARADTATSPEQANTEWQTAEQAEQAEPTDAEGRTQPSPAGETPDKAPEASASGTGPAEEEYMSAQNLDLSNIQFAPPRNETQAMGAPDDGPETALEREEAEPVFDFGEKGSPQSGENVLTLLKACRLAVKHHPLTEEAVATKDEEEANYGEARSVYFPRISLSANLGPSQDLDTDVTEYGDTTLAVTQTIFNFGGLQSDVAAARLKADSARLRFARTNEDIAALAINSYLTILQAQELVDVYNEALDFYQKLLDTFWERYNTGISSKADAQKVQVSLKSTESQLVVQNEQLKTAREPVAKYHQGAGGGGGERRPSAFRGPQGHCGGILRTRPGKQHQPQGHQCGNRGPGGNRLLHPNGIPPCPSDTGWRSKNEFEKIDGYKQTLDAQLTLNWNLFNGFGTNERIKKQQAILRRLKAGKRSTELEVQNIITDAFNSFDASQQEYLLAKQAYEDSVYLMSLYLSEFDLGIRTPAGPDHGQGRTDQRGCAGSQRPVHQDPGRIEHRSGRRPTGRGSGPPVGQRFFLMD